MIDDAGGLRFHQPSFFPCTPCLGDDLGLAHGRPGIGLARAGLEEDVPCGGDDEAADGGFGGPEHDQDLAMDAARQGGDSRHADQPGQREQRRDDALQIGAVLRDRPFPVHRISFPSNSEE